MVDWWILRFGNGRNKLDHLVEIFHLRSHNSKRTPVSTLSPICTEGEAECKCDQHHYWALYETGGDFGANIAAGAGVNNLELDQAPDQTLDIIKTLNNLTVANRNAVSKFIKDLK